MKTTDEKKDKPSNGRHILREAHTAKREQQLVAVADRQRARLQRTPEQQLEILDKRLGLNVGAKKERARLLQSIMVPRVDRLTGELI